MKRNIFYFLILSLFLSCKTDSYLIKYSITKYKEVGTNYQYSKEMFWFKKKNTNQLLLMNTIMIHLNRLPYTNLKENYFMIN
ncbi:hypothetical protein CLV55_105202 [Flavobacterium aciduliphilum]|uniref:Lipoprotein n=1 Tax=Flavobacterium aciduliphilum TaxID=1101402 RepID=A0A328YF46_9FLAO|nr:hypothetical protein CLV55_105202 [Flavobacterium aciduliphilum]